MRFFDAYFAVDWSSRNSASPAKPTHDAIWVGEAIVGGTDAAPKESYWRTRESCIAYLEERLRELVAAERRVLVGCDFAYGYPSGFAAALGLPDGAAPWRRTWRILSDLISDAPDNRNNRFAVAALLNGRVSGLSAGPFWGCPVGLSLPNLRPTSPTYPYSARDDLLLERLRWADRIQRGVQPVWKLYGTGSVGGQTLVGIPAVTRLRDAPDLAASSQVWPFETGFTLNPAPAKGPYILHAEIWPGIVRDLDPTLSIRDQAQVRAVVGWLLRLDSAGELGRMFAAPDNLPAEGLRAAVSEEGWILGAGLVV